MLFRNPTRYRRDLFFSTKPAPRKKTVLNVKARVNSQRQARNKHVVVVVGALMCLGLCALLLWVLGRAFFFSNSSFNLASVKVQTGKTISADLIKSKTGLMEGTNMFAVNIRDARENFMRMCPIVRGMEITRILPDTVTIKVTERLPVARLGFKGSLYIDEEGCTFGLQQGVRNLPIISGSDIENLRPGSKIEGAAMAALQLLNACAADWSGMNHDMIIESVELKGARQLDLHVVYDQVSWKGRLAWNDMGKSSSEATAQLFEKLAKMRTVFKTCPSNRAGTFDARGPDVYVQ